MSTPIKIPEVSTKVMETTRNVDQPQALPTTPVVASSNQRVTLADLMESMRLNETIEEEPLVTFVDTPTRMKELLDALVNLPVDPPSLFIDIEGVNLSRHGTISIMQIFVLPERRVFLVDIHTLKYEAFSQQGPSGITLGSVLESPSIPKVFYDVRNDSDALFAHYQIALDGIQDLQLMELATRKYSRKYVSGLGKCIERDAPMTSRERANWKHIKDTGRNLFAPELGGSYEVFNTRPLPDRMVHHCAQDVRFLPKLLGRYHQAMTPAWAAKVEREVRNRIELSQSATFNSKGRHMALGPKHWL
ncbi:hypothetical protein N7507_008477 [Penicillium longicatenatum]|nr:hypothetical protein N7507_008477 [Penicillium longicatenatum]